MIDLRTGDCRDVLATLPAESVHCVVTSPPYWGLRDYQCAGQLGLEASPAQYVEDLVSVLREVRRVLRDDGTLWLNLGDSYASSTKGSGGAGKSTLGPSKDLQNIKFQKMEPRSFNCGLAAKQLIGIPWRVAFALQSDGWYLRQDIIWSKSNPMPESVRDRCTKAHEYIFLLSKN
jgi:DNA modification methylase